MSPIQAIGAQTRRGLPRCRESSSLSSPHLSHSWRLPWHFCGTWVGRVDAEYWGELVWRRRGTICPRRDLRARTSNLTAYIFLSFHKITFFKYFFLNSIKLGSFPYKSGFPTCLEARYRLMVLLSREAVGVELAKRWQLARPRSGLPT